MKLSHAEAHLVKHLLNLFHVTMDRGRCKARCECLVCESLAEAGNHNETTFESLEDKAEAAMR
jgi:hypothetical protein